MVDISLTYKTKLMKIPTPRFVVFYNGTVPMEDEKVYRLSDMFENRTDNPELELVVKVLNINEGHNKELLDAFKSSLLCPSLTFKTFTTSSNSGLSVLFSKRSESLYIF